MSTRSCGFCRTPGHTVKTCTHTKATDLIHTAEFKCNIALQYVETPESYRIFSSIREWFSERSIAELRLLISKKGWIISGNKEILVTRAIVIYYFNRPIRFYSENNRNRFITVRQHWYEDGMTYSLATRQYDIDMQWLREREREGEQEQQQQPEKKKIKIINLLELESVDCPICFETEEKNAITNCGHQFCRGCIDKHTKGFISSCPCCRTEISDIRVN